MSTSQRSFLPPSMAHQLYGPARSYAPGYRPVYAARQPARLSSASDQAPRSRSQSQASHATEAPVSPMPLPVSLAHAA